MSISIVQVGASDIGGGAGRAMYRLHKGLNEIGCISRILTREKKTKDDSVIPVVPEAPSRQDEHDFLSSVLQRFYVDSNRTAISNTLFSFYQPGFDLADSKMIQEADIIHLHWIIGVLTPKSIQDLLSLKKPVVWTLHDQWAFTGGCHYSAGCRKYRSDCQNCPQLEKDPMKITEVLLKDKKALFESDLLTVLAPSRWMADCARESAVFRNHRIEVIPNAIETDIFRPMSKLSAKKKFGIKLECKTILMCALQSAETRKGTSELTAAIIYAMSYPEFRSRVEEGNIALLFLGEAGCTLENLPVPVKSLGRHDADETIRMAYAAADLFVLPSLEDNFPNTMLEAMSCGIPTLAFSTGGIPEAVSNGFNGMVVPSKDYRQLGKALITLLNDQDLLGEMGLNSREKALKEYRLDVQAQRHCHLYEDLLANGEKSKQRIPALPVAENHPAPLSTTIGPRSDPAYQTALLKSLKGLDANRNTLIDQVQSKEIEIQNIKRIADERLKLASDLSLKLENVQEKQANERQETWKRIDKLEMLVSLYSKYIESQNHKRKTLKDWHRYERFKNFLNPRLGVFQQYPPRPLNIPKSYYNTTWNETYPSISIVTPTLNQGTFIHRTIKSILDQDYPYLEYQIIDGGSKDGTLEILQQIDNPSISWVSEKDEGQANAINRGFKNSTGEIMCYLNSDDMLLPGSLHYVASFFLNNPEIDIIYGHRIVIDENDFEIGRWVMPKHNHMVLNWADYIPQETLFWRRGIWEKAGGFIDEDFKFAIDWELLLRFRDAGARFKRVPRFLGTFRIHPLQKTSKELEKLGETEMCRIRKKYIGREVDYEEINKNIRNYMNSHIFLTKLYRAGILRY